MFLGCNYWASASGIRMWRNWDGQNVEDDLRRLSAYGISTLRVFPTWDDFQPVEALYRYGGIFKEYRMRDGSLPQNEYYLDEEMLAHFAEFCKLCEAYNMKLIVGLLTGWMSGRLFVPAILQERNLYTDSRALLFEQRFIKGFVSRFKNEPVIYAWDLGNECNCLSLTENREDAASWTAIIANTIRAYDSTRPVVSGMHSLGCDNVWTIFDQAEHTDILTTHPYPYFVEHCSMEPFSSIRTLLHATCETRYYADLSGKPCLVEEIGNLGNMACDKEMAANFLRVNLFSNWAHGAPGVLWWCANEQTNLTYPPYSWMMCERELGLLDADRRPKPVLREYKQFADWQAGLGFELPPARVDGVCITSKWQDNWGISYMSYILAKQAGVNLRFAHYSQQLPDAKVYLLPSVTSHVVIELERYNELKERVKNGATLYISMDDGFMTEFEELTGLRIHDSADRTEPGSMNGLEYTRKRMCWLEPVGAEVLQYDDQGNIAFSKHQYGKGTVHYLNFPVEKVLLTRNNGFAEPYYKIYNDILGSKYCKNVTVGITIHEGDGKTYLVAVNYSGREQSLEGLPFRAEKVHRGDVHTVGAYDCCVLEGAEL